MVNSLITTYLTGFFYISRNTAFIDKLSSGRISVISDTGYVVCEHQSKVQRPKSVVS